MTLPSKLRRRFLATAAISATALASGCKVNSINSFPSHPASVRVMNLMPDVPAIDLSINGSPAFTNVAFESITGYQSYDNRTTSFGVSVSGTTTQLSTFSFPLAGDQPYTVVVYGALGSPQLTMVAEIGDAPSNGNIQLTIFNASPNAGSIDVYVTTPGVDLGTVNPNYYNVSYGGTTTSQQFPPGAYQIRLTSQGTKTVIYDSGGSALTPNVALSLITYSRGSGTLVNAQVLQARGPSTILNTIFARVKAFNAAAEAIPVDQLIGPLDVNVGVGFAAASPYTQIPQGPTTVAFEASAVPGATLAESPANIVPGTDVSTFLSGPVGNQQVFVVQDLNVAPAAGFDRIRVINASWNSNPVNVAINGTQIASNVAYGTASGYASVAAATVTIVFSDATTGLDLTSQTGVVLTPFQTLTLYLVGPQGAQSFVVIQDY